MTEKILCNGMEIIISETKTGVKVSVQKSGVEMAFCYADHGGMK